MWKQARIIVMLVALATARQNITKIEEEQGFLGKYPQLTVGIFTGLTIVGILCGFCCCALLCYICLRTHSQGPTVLQSLGNSLRRGPANLVEAHNNEFTTRHNYEVVPDREEAAPLTPREEQPPKLPPRPAYQTPLPATSKIATPEKTSAKAPTMVRRGPPTKPKRSITTTKIPQASTSGEASKAAPQPKMGIQVKKAPTPKNRGTFKKRNKYYNLDPVLVQREQILTHDTGYTQKEVREPPIQNMSTFKPRQLWAELDGPTLAKARLSNISLKAFPETREKDTTTTPPNTPNTSSEEAEEEEFL